MVGGIWAYYEGFIYPQFAIDPLVTIGMVLMTFLGGRGTLWGPVLGAFLLEPSQQYLAQPSVASSTSSRTHPCSSSHALAPARHRPVRPGASRPAAARTRARTRPPGPDAGTARPVDPAIRMEAAR